MGIVSMARSNGATAELFQNHVQGVGQASTLRRAMVQMRLDVSNQALALGATEKKEDERAVADDEKEATDALAALKALDLSSTQRGYVADVEQQLAAYVAARDGKLLPAGRANDIATWTNTSNDQATAIVMAMNAAVTNLVADEKAAAQAATDAVAAEYRTSRLLMLGALAIGLSAAVALGLFVARGICAASAG